MTTAHLYVDASEWPDTVDVVGGEDHRWTIRLRDSDGLHIRISGTPDELRTFGAHIVDIADQIDGPS